MRLLLMSHIGRLLQIFCESLKVLIVFSLCSNTHNTFRSSFFTGGTAMLTLIINAPTCGPVLKKLGLVTPTETRLKIIEKYRRRMIQHSLTEYVSLLADERFHDLDFTTIREHVPFLRDVTYEQLKAAVKRHEVSIT